MKADAYTFAAEVDRQIESLGSSDYHIKRGRSKRLLEELYPLSRYALRLKQPGLSVQVEAFENDGPVDGQIIVTGFKELTVDVEVTSVYSYDEALRAELLVKQAWVWGAGEIARSPDGAVVAEVGVVDGDHHIQRVAQDVLARLETKAAKAYSPDTVLVIAFEEMKLYGRYWWDQLLAKAAIHERADARAFGQVYLFNCATNELHCAA